MFDLGVHAPKRCLICRERTLHGECHRPACKQMFEKLVEFLDEYRLGVGDRYNFDVAITVRGSKIVFIRHPSHWTDQPKKSVC